MGWESNLGLQLQHTWASYVGGIQQRMKARVQSLESRLVHGRLVALLTVYILYRITTIDPQAAYLLACVPPLTADLVYHRILAQPTCNCENHA